MAKACTAWDLNQGFGSRLCRPNWVQGRKVQREHKVDHASSLGWLVRPALDSWACLLGFWGGGRAILQGLAETFLLGTSPDSLVS